MIHATEARVATPNARKYALQLGKHWGHNLHVTEAGDARLVTFPKNARGAQWEGDAIVTLRPEGDTLVCRIDASEANQREGLKSAVERHIERFAFREEALSFAWIDRMPPAEDAAPSDGEVQGQA